MSKIVVTGIGLITPIGTGKQALVRSLKQRKSGTRRVDQVESQVESESLYPLNLEGISAKVAAPVLNFNPSDYMSKRRAKRIGRNSQLIIGAAQQALEDAGIEFQPKQAKMQKFELKEIQSSRAGTTIGTCIGDLKAFTQTHRKFLQDRTRRFSPFFAPRLMANAPAGNVAIQFGLQGPAFTVSGACASGNYALETAIDKIRAGQADLMVAGGVESVLLPFMLASFHWTGALTGNNENPQRASRPFDRQRDGFVPGEGAGVLILEAAQHAQQRGAEIQAELLSYGETNDAYHVSQPHPEAVGATMAMNKALTNGKIKPSQIDYINAHGTSTPLNDKLETKAIKDLFGQQTKIPISSTKSQLGHLIGGAGVVEAAATILAMNNDFIPATINLENPDPECDLDYVPDGPRSQSLTIALSNSFGFGGHNSSLCIKV